MDNPGKNPSKPDQPGHEPLPEGVTEADLQLLDVLDKAPINEKIILIRRLIAESESHQTSSPIAPPEWVEAYNREQAGLGTSIIENHVAESNHRRAREDDEAEFTKDMSRRAARFFERGQVLAFLICAAIVTYAFFLLAHKQYLLGTSLLGGLLIASGVLLWRHRHPQASRASDEE
jgi:hypothetical protein